MMCSMRVRNQIDPTTLITMHQLKTFAFTVGLFVGLSLLQNAESNKTEDIQSIAEAMDRECTNHLLNYSCYEAKAAVDNADSVSTICQAMKTYRVCQNLNCFNKSAHLIDLLNNTELINTCRQVVNMTLEPEVENVISEVNAMKDECNFKPDRTCIRIAGAYHLTSTKLADICQARQHYGGCLQVLCLSPSTALSDKFVRANYGLSCGPTQLQNVDSNKTEGIKIIAEAMHSECVNHLLNDSCDGPKRAVDNSGSLSTICQAMKTYRVCQNLNCYKQSSLLKELLNYPELIETCGQVVNMTLLEPEVENVISEVNAMKDECNFEPGHTCYKRAGTYHFTSIKIADVCQTRQDYGECLQLLCRSPSFALRDKFVRAKYGLSCGPTQLQNEDSNKPEGIKIIAGAIRSECVNHLMSDSCDGSKRAVDNSQSLSTICQAMKTYRVCQNLNCYKKSALLIELLNYKALIETCGQVVNMTLLEPGVENVISEVNAMKDECNFEPGQTCNKIAGTYHFTSTKIADVCQARKYYGECLQLLCQSPSFDLRDRFDKARKGLSCDGSGLSTSVVVMVIVAVVNYLCSL